MIADLDETIRQLLIREGKLDPAEVDIVFDMPDREWSAKISKPTINLYLYDIHENLELRDFDWEVIHDNGRATRFKPPLRIDLSYLITVWTNDMADQHRLLGHVLKVLMRYQELPEDKLHGSLNGINFPLRTKTAQPDSILRNAADFWSALDNSLRPSINYVVTIPLDLEVAITAPEVKTKLFKLRDDTGSDMGSMIQISGIIRRKGKYPEAISNATVMLKEAQLTAVTDEKGNYAFRNVAEGNYTLEITFDDGKKQQMPMVIPSSNYDIEI